MEKEGDKRGQEGPDWVRDAIIYQILPDRFRNGDPTNDPENVCPWGSEPTLYNFMGGDLQGIIDKIDYLKDLGVNTVYLNPIYWASSPHKYNPHDFYRVDPRFGDQDLFEKLVYLFHKNRIRIILDGVFNHSGRGFFPFYDVMENKKDSAYKDWFHIEGFPVEAYGEHKYATWGNSRANPKLNVKNPATRRYLLDVAAFWTRKGLDGWRLDAASEVEDHTFWEEFKGVVRNINPEVYILGEIWEDATDWLEANEFDGVTNYAFRGALIDFFIDKTVGAPEFARRLDTLASMYPSSAVDSMYNLLGSHDTPRIFTIAQGNIRRLKLAVLFQLAYRGVPAIYYGDEIGLQGGDDPLNRRTMPWDESLWNLELRESYRSLIRLRKEILPLRRGDWKHIFSDKETNTCAFSRRTPAGIAFIAINNGNRSAEIRIHLDKCALPVAAIYVDKVNQHPVICKSNELILPDFPSEQGAIIVPV
jgi:glycosidase